MRPNNFVLNSDYLSLGMIGQTNTNFDLPSRSVGQGSATFDYTFDAPSQSGAIDRVVMQANGGSMFAGFNATISENTSPLQDIELYLTRVGSSTFRLRARYLNNASSSHTFSSYQLNIRVSTFRPSNIT